MSKTRQWTETRPSMWQIPSSQLVGGECDDEVAVRTLSLPSPDKEGRASHCSLVCRSLLRVYRSPVGDRGNCATIASPSAAVIVDRTVSATAR